MFARTRELAELSPEAGRLVEVLDRPLLVTVMGEFNSGKSTFVNALIGEEVAPMGITPTTATINVLKYGAERKGRVVYHDDETREVPWDEVPKLLKGLDAAEARRIRVVEVLYPLETLQRVNVVDTPGLNSIHPEHEATARQFIAEADAVLWLFTVDQAAKATEGEAVGKIKAAGKKILGVVNKIDRCSPDELAQIVTHVQAALGEHLETVVPFAAREALRARKSKDDAQLAASNYPALAEALEQRFFSRSRAIKREAATLRLRQLLGEARTRGHAELEQRALEPIGVAEANVRAERLRFTGDFVVSERRRLTDEADQVYAACAREVLDFVRPRRWAFGSNEAAPADRDFLIQLLDERLGALLEAARGRAASEAERAIALVREVDPDARFDAELSLLGEQVFGRFRAFARGWLRGGRVDDFFTRVLPKLDLTEAAIRRALERDAPWSDDVAETELRTPLRAWADRFYGELLARLARLRVAVEVDRLEIEERLIAPVEAIANALDSLS
jgi:small GTP-binding protein